MTKEERDRINAGAEVSMPLDRFVLEIATHAAEAVLQRHMDGCPIAAVVERVRVLEIRLSTLVGMMVGSGLLGGGTAAVVSRWLWGSA